MKSFLLFCIGLLFQGEAVRSATRKEQSQLDSKTTPYTVNNYNGIYAEPSKKLEHVILGMKKQLDEIQKNLKGSSCKGCSNNTKG